jgi:hypothetical protein
VPQGAAAPRTAPVTEQKKQPAPASAPAAKTEPPGRKEEEKERSLDDIILDFLAQEQKERNLKK